MATICDIAKRVGVTAATVSKVLNGRNKGVYGGAVAERARRIHEVAAELGYRPNHAARSIRSKRSGIVALLVWEVDNPYSGKLVKKFELALHDRGYRLLLGITGGEKDSEEYLRQFPGGMVDAVINADSFLSREQTEKYLAPIPVVTYCRDEISPARINIAQATTLAMEHLFELGHRRIGLIHGFAWDADTKMTLETYRGLLAKHGIEHEPSWISGEDWGNEGVAFGQATRMLRCGCTAIMAASDPLAIQAMSAMQSVGVRVPEDVSIIGRDDSPTGLICTPRLTTIRFAMNELVQKHVDAVLALIELQAVAASVVLDSQLVLRQSTAKCSDTFDFVEFENRSAVHQAVVVSKESNKRPRYGNKVTESARSK